MDMLLAQLPLSRRIPALADAIRSLRASTAQNAKEEAELLGLLRDAEQQLQAHPAGSEDTAPSGLLSEPSGAEPAPKAKATKR